MSILQNAADVLRCFSKECPELTVTEVVRRLGLPKANASRLLKAMREAGLLEIIGDSYRHRPGRLMLDLGTAYRSSSNLIARAGEVVGEVSQRFGHTGYISLRDGLEVTGVADFPGTNALRVVGAIGRRLTAHESATGRSLLARLPDEEVRALFGGRDVPTRLYENLAKIRRDGFSLSSQEATPGVDAIAIAVGDPATEEAVSLCIVYPHSLVDDKGRDEMIAALSEGATRIAGELGDTAYVSPRI